MVLVRGKIKHLNPCGAMEIQEVSLPVSLSGKGNHDGSAGKIKTL
jgi:hypothetical protein